MKRKFTALILAVCLGALCVPFMSGCSAQACYTLKTDENGDKYYSASCSGVSTYLSGEVEISAYYGEGENRYPVKEIEAEGFVSTLVTKFTIPATVTKINTAAFAFNNYLKTIEFEEGSQLEELGQGAFGYCPKIKEISLPQSVKTIGYMAFYECTELESVEMPAVQKILASAFENCTVLEGVTFPQTLTMIGARAFAYTAIKEIVIPDSVTNITIGEDIAPAIGYAAFHSCTRLESAVVGSGVTEINAGVFGYCTSLKRITLPATITKIEGARYNEAGEFICGHAFHTNKNEEGKTVLSDIYYGGTAEQWETLKTKIDNKPVTYNGSEYNNDALFVATVHFAE